MAISRSNSTLKTISAKDAWLFQEITKIIFPPRGRPRKYSPCERYGSHRFRNDRCPCGETRDPDLLVLRLAAQLNGQRQWRAVRAANRLKEVIDGCCKADSNEPFQIH